VSRAGVSAGGHTARIDRGLVVLLRVEKGNAATDVESIARKIRELRSSTIRRVRTKHSIDPYWTLAATCQRGDEK
jgi:D-Tyr-tRNAtyr deacylase